MKSRYWLKLFIAGLASFLWACGGLLDTHTVVAASVTVDGTRTNQLIEGFGVNANHRSWSGNELKPVLDALIDQAGMTLFRVIYDNTDWEATNDNADPNVFNWTYYNTVYAGGDFQKMWDQIAYLNQRGISNGIVLNFMGPGPAWLGGQNLTAGLEDEWAETVASLFYYARNTRGLQFNLIAPDNEPDITQEGIHLGAAQYVNCLHKLALKLDAIGLGDLRFVGPDLAGGDSSYRDAIVADPTIMAKLAHWSTHGYSAGAGSGGMLDFIQGSAYPGRTFWQTEFNVWCSTCDSGTRGTYDWPYCRGTAEYLLSHLDNGASGALVYEGYDSYYMHHGAWGFWGLFSVDNENAAVKTYTPRKNFYTVAQISRFVRPGSRGIDVAGTPDPFSPLLAFHHASLGQVTLVGINTSNAPATLQGTLASLPAIGALDLYYTSATTNLAYAGSFPVTNGAFSATIPADCVFTLVNGATSLTATLTSPAYGATFNSPALVPLAAAVTGSTNPVTKLEFFSGTTKIATDTNAPYSFLWPNVPTGSYSLTARVTDDHGLIKTSAPAIITVTAPAASVFLGNTNEGSTTDTITDATGAWINANRCISPASMTVTLLRAKIGAIAGRYQCAIYSDNAGSASRLLRATIQLTNVAPAGWHDFTLTAPLTLTNGSYYWLAIWSDDLNARVYADPAGTLRFAAYPYGAWPDPVNLSGTGTFTYSIYAPGTPRPPFDQWKSNYGLPAGTPYNSDGDNDGIPLLLEYALGLDPLVSSTNGLPTGTATNSFLTLTYTKIKAATDITCTAEVADKVTGPWLSTTNDVEQLWQVLDGLTTQIITARDRTAVSNAPVRFMRLKVSNP